MSVTAKAKSAIAMLVASAAALSAVAPAAANDWYYEEPQGFERPLHAGEFQSSRTIRSDDVGRYFIRHGRKHYIQFWDAPRHPRPLPPVRHGRDNDKAAEAAIIAGIAGLAVGAIIAGSQRPQQQVAQPLPRPLPRNAFPVAPSNGPRVITYDNAFEPWSDEWADWCADRYRSFNVRTGTYTGYDGVKRFCEVK
jgi:hypothetical protein